MKKEPTEKEIENSILDYLQTQDGFFWKNQSVGIYDPIKKTFRRPGKFHVNGVADILGLIPPSGKLVAIEVKRRKGKTTKAQDDFLQVVSDNGGESFVARSIEDVEEKLNELQTKNKQEDCR